MRTHGKIGTYKDGCRCEECKRASREYMRERRYRLRELEGDASGEMCVFCLQTFHKRTRMAQHEAACPKR